MFKNEIIMYLMFSKFFVMINIENFKNFWKKIEKTFKIDTNAILNDICYRIIIAINSLKKFSNFVRWNFFFVEYDFSNYLIKVIVKSLLSNKLY